MPRNPIIRAYLEANRRLMAETNQMPIGIAVTFLGAALWEYDRADPEPPMALEELAEQLDMRPTTVSEHLRYLGYGYRVGRPGLGLVWTTAHPDSGRKKVFHLTARGRRLIWQLEAILSSATGK